MKFKRLPKHIGVIPDGNRRWAVARGMNKEEGYYYGLEPGRELYEIGRKLGIEEVSIYAFTQENTHRAREQVAAFKEACEDFIEWLGEEDVSVLVVGDSKSPLFPEKLKKFTVRNGNDSGKMKLNFLVNYSWKWDLNMISQKDRDKPITRSRALESVGSNGVSRLDLIIRWGGRRRLSGFLPLQSAYADIYVLDELWPDFKPEQFYDALRWYDKQDITLGG